MLPQGQLEYLAAGDPWETSEANTAGLQWDALGITCPQFLDILKYVDSVWG